MFRPHSGQLYQLTTLCPNMTSKQFVRENYPIAEALTSYLTWASPKGAFDFISILIDWNRSKSKCNIENRWSQETGWSTFIDFWYLSIDCYRQWSTATDFYRLSELSTCYALYMVYYILEYSCCIGFFGFSLALPISLALPPMKEIYLRFLKPVEI